MRQHTFTMILFLLILSLITVCVLVMEESSNMRAKALKSMIGELEDGQSLFEERLVELERSISKWKEGRTK